MLQKSVRYSTPLNVVLGTQPSYAALMRAAKRILRRSQDEVFPYVVSVAERRYIVLRNVFSPRYYNHTEWFAEALPVRTGHEVLEIGAGMGAIAITLALRGALVRATDINHAAVRNTRLNVELHGVESMVEVYRGDLFTPVSPRRFDLVFWDYPFYYLPSCAVSALDRAVFDPGYHTLDRFLPKAHLHLKPGGGLYLGFSSSLGKPATFHRLIAKHGYDVRVVETFTTTERRSAQFELLQLLHGGTAMPLAGNTRGA